MVKPLLLILYWSGVFGLLGGSRTMVTMANDRHFVAIALGTAGGINEANLSSYLLAPAGSPDFVALDAGTLLTGLEAAHAQFSTKKKPTACLLFRRQQGDREGRKHLFQREHRLTFPVHGGHELTGEQMVVTKASGRGGEREPRVPPHLGTKGQCRRTRREARQEARRRHEHGVPRMPPRERTEMFLPRANTPQRDILTGAKQLGVFPAIL